MESRAIRRFVRSSPRKMRLLIDLVRGKSVKEALTILKFSTKAAAVDAASTIRSAASNLENQTIQSLDLGSILIKEAFVNQGPTAKRISPAPQGRAYRIRKRSHHLTVIVSTDEN